MLSAAARLSDHACAARRTVNLHKAAWPDLTALDALQEGYFDAEGNYVSYRTDVVKDAWLDTLGEGERQAGQWSMLTYLLTGPVLTACHSSHAPCLQSQRFQP